MATAKINQEGFIVVNGQEAVIPQAAERWLRDHQDQEAYVFQYWPGRKAMNGHAYTNTGWALIVLDCNGQVKPVIGSQDKGYQSERHTYQAFDQSSGDICLMIEWGNGYDSKFILECATPNDLVHYIAKPYDYRMELPQEAIDWLQPRPRGASYLSI